MREVTWEDKQMRKVTFFLVVLVACVLASSGLAQSSRPIPPYPAARKSVRPSVSEREKAQKLFELLKKENGALRWNYCLSTKAFLRAKEMVAKGYFEHEDPRTGTNPVWGSVRQCFPCRSAGENLAKGMDTPEHIHKALMESPTHRKNIKDRRFTRAGVGCYNDVCVELFAGL